MGTWSTETAAVLQERGILLVEDGNHGEYRPRPDEFVDEGVAFIRAADMDGGHVLFATAAKINANARGRITKGVGAPGDVLLSHKGTVGKVAIVGFDVPDFVCSPQTTFWRALDRERLDRGFLYAFLRSPGFQAQLASRSSESDMAPYVSLTNQRGLLVALPPIDEQRAIAALLGVFDRKIELNRRMSETLEEMARAQFKSWFVDFDPVRANAEGRDPGLPGPLADLFPSRFVDSDLGEIPEGWDLTAIGELVDICGGSTPRTDNPIFWDKGVHAWVTPKDLSRLSSPVLLRTERRVTDAGLAQIGSGMLPKGTVLLSSRAPIGYVAIAELPVAINQGFIAMKPSRASSLFLMNWVRSHLDEIISHANGSTFLEISKASFRPIRLVVPPPEVAARFDRLVEPLYRRLVLTVRQTETLAAVRDALLPKLLSGELRVSVAERMLEDLP